MTMTIRRLQSGDLPAALKLTQAERWPHRLEDWQFHFRLGRGWAACGDDGALLGTATWWSHGEHYGSVGLVVVERSQQGRGIGRRLLETIIDDAASRSLQLVATQAGLKLYRQCGFDDVGMIEQRQGMMSPLPAPLPPAGATLRRATVDDLQALTTLDTAAFGAPRHELIRHLLAEGTGIVATLAGQPVGFVIKRQAGRGTLIGPVVASTESLAIALVAQALDSSAFTRIDIPADAERLARWLDEVGMVKVDTVTAMRRGDASARRTDVHTFALVSQAFG